MLASSEIKWVHDNFYIFKYQTKKIAISFTSEVYLEIYIRGPVAVS